MSDNKQHSVLLLNSSGKQTESISRKLAAQVVSTLEKHGKAIDFASGHVKQALRFVGITDVTIIDAATVASRGIETVLESAEQQISDINYALSA